MPAFFGLLRGEEHPAVRVALGYFIFVYTWTITGAWDGF